MDVAALIVAIVALLFAVSAAGFGVYIQFQTYKATTDHLRGVEGSVSGFRTDMQGLVGELKGMTDTLVEAQQHQFNRMLDAFVTRPGAVQEVADKTGESADNLQEISEAMEGLKGEIRRAASADEVQHKLDELGSRLEAVSESTARAARLAELAAEAGPSVSGHLIGPSSPDLFVESASVARGGRVEIRARAHGAKQFSCMIRSPDNKAAWSAAFPPTHSGPWDSVTFVFPDHFPGASTDHPGSYSVLVRAKSSYGSVRGARTSFEVQQ